MYRYKALKIKGRRIDEHRLVSNVIDAGYNTVVHHKDGNPRNNNADNLEVMTRSEHAKQHGLGTVIRSHQIFGPDVNGKAIYRECGLSLVWSEFRVDCTWLNGRASICRNCWNSYRRERRKARSHRSH